MSARAPYGKPFAYRPQFKLWMSTIHKPEIPDGSEAIWDRMRLIPFTQRFDGKDADPKLPKKLREELPGVLAWAVRGCVEWMQSGLGTSEAVEKATQAYREETDILDRFFADECVFAPEARVTKRALFEAWEQWCDAEGEDAGKQNSFTRIIKERGVVKGFREGRIGNGSGWHGIGIATPPPDEKVHAPEKSCKSGGVVEPNVHFSENGGKFSTNPPRVETSPNSGEKGTERTEVHAEGVNFDIEGVEWTYIPREES